MEKVGEGSFGASTAVGTGGAVSLLIIEAASDLGPATEPVGVGTISALLTTSSGKVSLGKYEVGLDDETGVDGLVK
jgi:hypothetical protein